MSSMALACFMPLVLSPLISRISSPTCGRKERKGRRKQEVGSGGERQSDRWWWKGEEVNQRGKGETAKGRKKKRRQRSKTECEKTSDSGERKYTRGEMRGNGGSKGHGDSRREGERRTDWGEVTYRILWTVNCKTATFYLSKSTVSRKGKMHRKSSGWERKMSEREREEKNRSQKTHSLLLCLHASSYPSVLSVPREFLSGRVWISHWHLSLPHRAATINISANKEREHKRAYSYLHVEMCEFMRARTLPDIYVNLYQNLLLAHMRTVSANRLSAYVSHSFANTSGKIN